MDVCGLQIYSNCIVNGVYKSTVSGGGNSVRIGCTIFMIVQHNGYVGQYQYNCHANGQYIVYERMICLDDSDTQQ